MINSIAIRFGFGDKGEILNDLGHDDLSEITLDHEQPSVTPSKQVSSEKPPDQSYQRLFMSSTHVSLGHGKVFTHLTQNCV